MNMTLKGERMAALRRGSARKLAQQWAADELTRAYAEVGELRKALIESESRTIELTEGMLKLIHESDKPVSSRQEKNDAL